MRSSEHTDKIDAAMSRAQAALEPVKKNKGVKVDSEKAKWESRFATFAVLHAACKAALAGQGIAIYQGGAFIQGGGERLVTRLALAGQWIESDFPIKPTREGSQGFGGGISFAKRWGLCAMVGLVAEDDHEEAQGYRDERPAKPQKQKGPPGISAILETIRGAASFDELATAAIAARSAFSVGEPAVAVEKTITDWYVHELDRAKDPDTLTLARDSLNRVKPRGDIVRQALARADKRIFGDA